MIVFPFYSIHVGSARVPQLFVSCVVSSLRRSGSLCGPSHQQKSDTPFNRRLPLWLVGSGGALSVLS